MSAFAMPEKALRVTIILICVFMAVACGYGFKPGGEYIDKDIRSVFVDVFVNKTSEANIENTFRAAFIDQFIQGKRFRIVDSQDRADAVFKGSIENLSTAPLSYRTTNLAAEERFAVTLSLTFEQRDNKKIIWTDPAMTSVQDYTVGNNPTMTQTNKNNALVKLSNDTAERAYRLMMSGF
jgi:hypothetical protein